MLASVRKQKKMRALRLFVSPSLGCSTLSSLRWCSSDKRPDSTSTRRTGEADALDGIFEELEKCDTRSSTSAPARGSSATPTAPNQAEAKRDRPLESLDYDDLRVREAHLKQLRLKRLIKDTEEEVRALSVEHKQEMDGSRLREYVPSQPAKPYLTTAELIQEKSPQHFYPDGDDAHASLDGVPMLEASGSTAVVSLVGRVTRDSRGPSSHQASGSAVSSADSCDIEVEYDVTLDSGRVTSRILVRCCGKRLSSFARDIVREGDLVHVLGNLLISPHSSDSGTAGVVVCVLPVGGNISVLLLRDGGGEAHPG